MNKAAIVIQQAGAATESLVLLFHGVGALPASMVLLGQRLAQAMPRALVVAVPSPFASDISAGLQWFSVRGVSEDNRQVRVDAVMPLFCDTVRHWQAEAGVDAAATTLVGFSQGGIMVLESSRLEQPPAATVVSFAGRFAVLPDKASAVRIHLLHGEQDGVMPVELARTAAERLGGLGTSVSLDTLPGIGHEPHPALVERAIARLREDATV